MNRFWLLTNLSVRQCCCNSFKILQTNLQGNLKRLMSYYTSQRETQNDFRDNHILLFTLIARVWFYILMFSIILTLYKFVHVQGWHTHWIKFISFCVFFFQLALDIWKRKMIEPLKETLVKHVLIEVKRLVIVLGNGGFVWKAVQYQLDKWWDWGKISNRGL